MIFAMMHGCMDKFSNGSLSNIAIHKFHAILYLKVSKWLPLNKDNQYMILVLSLFKIWVQNWLQKGLIH